MIKDLLKEITDLFIELISKEEAWIILFLIIFTSFFSINYFSLEVKPETLNALLRYLWHLFKQLWFLWVFIILFNLVKEIWLFYRQELFRKNLLENFITLEIKIPQYNVKSPRAMEQILTSIHSLRNAPGDPKGKWWDGEITRWFVLEIVSFGGEIHYYITLYKGYKKLVESAFFSYYPDIELFEVKDYVKKFPNNLEDLYKSGLDLWGTEMVLSKPSFYPIKTYSHFIEVEQEEKIIDPLSALLEVLGKISKDEFVGVQILIAPIGDDWVKKWKKDLEKLKIFLSGKISSKEESHYRTPGEERLLKEIENNLSKPAFKTLIRFIYLSPKNVFYDAFAQRGLIGFFRQFSMIDLNSFIQNSKVGTKTSAFYYPYIFPNLRNEYKKARLLRNYYFKDMPPETFFGKLLTSKLFNLNFASQPFELNVEGLATIFHLPTETVLTTPYFKKTEVKKISPMAGVEIFGKEDDLERFK